MLKLTFVASLLAGTLAAQAPASRPAGPPKFDLTAIDKSADPCQDFFQYACGSWIKNNPIPKEQSNWGRFSELAERNREILHQILEDSAKGGASRDATTQKIGDYFAACMDEKARNAKALAPIRPELDRIANLKDKAELAAVVARLHQIGVNVAFQFSSGADFKDSNMVIAQFDQGGLGLPDRDYYLKADAKSVDLRAKYTVHMQRMFELAGEKTVQAKADAQAVLKFETALAKGSLDLVSRRDPEKVYHKVDKKELDAWAPSFHWAEYFTAVGSPSFQSINVAPPEFVKALDGEIKGTSLAVWKSYLTWQLIHSTASFLPDSFVDENFNFYGKILTGKEVMRPMWKRCTDFTDQELGEALGRKYVEKTFGTQGKEHMLKMVNALETALGQDIEKLDWMTPETKKQAQVKLKAIANKIGYPDRWRDYSSVTIKPDDLMGNSFRAGEFENRRILAKIGKPVDRMEWEMTPPTVNAYYDPTMNNINFPAGILQPPFFSTEVDDAVNFGGIGMVIGHELTHGFDDEGRQFDADGNLKDWWTAKDAEEFQQRSACVADQYSGFSVVPGVYVNGKLTLGENTADNGGVRVALMALLNTIGEKKDKIDGYTPEQRFFLSFGQVWCQSSREEALRMQVQTDPHSPPRFRVNGVVVNMPEFQKAFACKQGQPMAPVHACRVW